MSLNISTTFINRILSTSTNLNDYERVDLDTSSVDSKLNQVEEKIIGCVFLTFIILGFFGNFLVIWTVLTNKHMRTTNNLFILNLAISDLTLCVFSIPFNVYKTLRHTWIFGEFLCKFAPFFQATNVFVSTMSITAIALDRYVNIVCAMKIRQMNSILYSYGTIAILVIIWVLAFMLSSPLFLFNMLRTISIDFKTEEFNQTFVNELDFDIKSDDLLFDDSFKQINIHHCIENSPFEQSRFIYSFVSLLIQYTLPFLIVGLAYGSIWWKLKSHRNKLKHHQINAKKKLKDKKSESKTLNVKYIPGTNSSVNNNPSMTNLECNIEKKNITKNQENKRRLKMNILLAFIAIIFAASWLPINLFNILSDSKVSTMKASHTFYLVNAICILLGMSSAVSNPFLYGFLNENFKREYVKLFRNLSTKILICFDKKKSSNAQETNNLNENKQKNFNNLIENKNLNNIKNNNDVLINENEKLLKSRPIILVNNESINDVV